MKWEYRTVMFEASRWFLGGKIDGKQFNDHLNQLGEEGWELVSAFDTNPYLFPGHDVDEVCESLWCLTVRGEAEALIGGKAGESRGR